MGQAGVYQPLSNRMSLDIHALVCLFSSVAVSKLFVNTVTMFPSVFKGYGIEKADESHCKRALESFDPNFALMF